MIAMFAIILQTLHPHGLCKFAFQNQNKGEKNVVGTIDTNWLVASR